MKKLSAVFKFLIIALFLLANWLFVAPLLAERLVVEKKLDKADAIVILSGSSVYIERTQEAAKLYKEGIAPKIILTNDGTKGGWSKTQQKNPTFLELAEKSLIGQGIPSESIVILPEEVTSTIDEARLLHKTSIEKSFKSLVIVTSGYHTRRALWIFEKVFKNEDINLGIRSSIIGQQTPQPYFWWLSINGWEMVGGEYVKSIYYWLVY